MTDDSDKDYYIAELVTNAQENSEVELSDEDMERVAELQEIHRDIDLNDYTPDYMDTDTMPEELRNRYEIVLAELIRRDRNMSDEDVDDAAGFFNISSEELSVVRDKIE